MKEINFIAQSGDASFTALFPEFKGTIKVDRSVANFLQLGGTSKFEVKSDFFVNFNIHEKGGKFFELLAPWPIMPTRDKFLVVLAYLGTPEGLKFLETREGQYESSVLLGYFEDGTRNLVLQVEHKKNTERGSKIHLYGADLHKEEDSVVTVFYIN